MFPFFITLEISNYKNNEKELFPSNIFVDTLIKKNKSQIQEITLLVKWSDINDIKIMHGFASILEKNKIPFRILFSEFEPLEENDSALIKTLVLVLRDCFYLREIEFELQSLDALHDRWENFKAALLPFMDYGMPIVTAIQLTAYLVENLEQIVENILNCGVDIVQMNRFSPSYNMKEIKADDIKNVLSRFATLYQEGWPVRPGGCFPYCNTPSLFNSCGGGVYSCVLKANGDCIPCRFSTHIFGNIKVAPLKPIWNSKDIEEWRLLKAAPCVDCPVFFSCRSGCKSQISEGIEDPLIKEFKKRLLPLPILSSLQINESLIAAIAGKYITTEDGDFLILGKRVLPVEEKWETCIKTVNKNIMTLKELSENYSEESIKYLFSLYLEGFIHFHLSAGR